MTKRGHITLSIDAAGDIPAEFCIFTAGLVETTKGTFLFDEAAASAVMADYKAHGIDLMIDYDHASLDSGSSRDPAQAGKAAGWFNLEVRADGSLWAVNVRWCEPAADALRRKEWRFMSPAFSTTSDGHITSLLNVAITNLPATRRLEPLMAASVVALGECMDPKLIGEALDALVAGDDGKCAEILKGLIAAAAGGEAPAEEAPTDAPMPEEMGAPAEASAALAEEPAKEEDEEKMSEVAAAASKLTRITGKSSLVGALDQVEVWRASHLKLEAETAKLAQERAALELSERKENAKKLVALGAETPHTSGLASFANGAKGKLSKRLLDESLVEQNERVAALLAARGGKLPTSPAPAPPVAVNLSGSTVAKSYVIDGQTIEVSEKQLAMCAKKKLDPEKYAKTRAAIKARSHKSNGAER